MDEENVHADTEDACTFKFSPQGLGFTIRYPITTELPHVHIPIGKQSSATAEGLLDTGGACTMGDISYWSEVAKRMPHLIAHYEELTQHQEKPISIGGVGAGKVMITHVMGVWLPWAIGKDDTKLVIGLGENMPMTLLIGLPFQVAAQCVIDIGNLTCHSATFNTTWKLTLKRPQRKDIRCLDAVMSSGKRQAFPTVASVVTPEPKKVKWDWEATEVIQE
jgi:hypothetical protein